MKQKIGIFLVAGCLAACQPTAKETAEAPANEPVVETAAAPVAPEGKLQHVVLFQFKAGTTPEQVAQIEEAFAALPAKIPEIKGLEWGTNVSPENKAEGFTHCFLVTFADEAGRDIYLPHPAHKEFGGIVGPHIEKVLVVDFIPR